MSISTSSPTAPLPNTGASLLAKLGIADFWRWWKHELGMAFAPWSARWLHNDEDITEIVGDGQSWLFTKSSQRGAQVNGVKIDRLGADGSAVQADEIKRAIAAAFNGRSRDVRLLISPNIALQKKVTYPAATLENLREVLAFDMDRQTPFNAAQVYFDVRRHFHSDSHAGSSDSAQNNPMVAIDLLAVPRKSLQPILQTLRDAGASIRSIGVVGDTGNPRFDLLPQAEQPTHRLSRRQIINFVLLGVIAALILIAIIVPIWQKRERAIALQPLLQKARAEADTTQKIATEFTRLSKEYNFVVGKKYSNQPVLEVVEELSRITPDTTWLMTFDMKTLANKTGVAIHEVQLTGEAASAAKMIELLEQSKLLQNASQRAQTTRGSQTSLERFQIATEIKPRALPALIPAGSLPDAGSVPAAASGSMQPATAPATTPAMAPAPTPSAISPSLTAKPVAATGINGKSS